LLTPPPLTPPPLQVPFLTREIFFNKHSHPIQPFFNQFVKGNLVKASQMRSYVPDVMDDHKSDILVLISGKSYTLSLDETPDPFGTKMHLIMVNVDDKDIAVRLKGFEKAMTHQDVAAELRGLLEDYPYDERTRYGLDRFRCLLIITDRAAYVVKAIKEIALPEMFPYAEFMQCLAHGGDNALRVLEPKKEGEQNPLKSALKALAKGVGALASPRLLELNGIYMRVQEQWLAEMKEADPSFEMKVIQPIAYCITRFGSIVTSAEYGLQRRGALLKFKNEVERMQAAGQTRAELPSKVVEALEILADQDKVDRLDTIIRGMRKLRDFITLTERSRPVIHCVHSQLSSIITTYQVRAAQQNDPNVRGAFSDVYQYLKDYEQKHPCRGLFLAASYLDPVQMKNRPWVQEINYFYVIVNGSKYVRERFTAAQQEDLKLQHSSFHCTVSKVRGMGT
jgi:hypothetical protein